MANPSTVDNLLKTLGGQAEAPRYIRAYHGSPYDFDRFDASKIGTGEGAQAYGHGLYFAGNEDVADIYRKALSGPYSQALAPMEDIPKFFAPGNVVPGYGGRDKVLRFFPGPDEEPWRWAVEVVGVDAAGVPKPYERPRIHRTHPAMRDVDTFFGREPTRPGHGYEVEIARQEEDLLDWDNTLDTQQHLLPQVERAINKIPDPAARYDNMLAIEEPHSFRGSEVHAVLRNALGGEPAAARALLDSGVPGVRYLDGNSRRLGQGTRNYVMFPGTEDSIRILRKYGLLAPIAAGGLQGGDSP